MKKQPVARKQITRGMGTKNKMSRLNRISTSLVPAQQLPSKEVLTEVLSNLPEADRLTAFEIRELDRLTKKNSFGPTNGNGNGQGGGESNGEVITCQDKEISDGLQSAVRDVVAVMPTMVSLIKGCLDPGPESIWSATPIRDRAKFVLDMTKAAQIWMEKERLYRGRPGSHSLTDLNVRSESSIDEQIIEVERMLTGRVLSIKR